MFPKDSVLICRLKKKEKGILCLHTSNLKTVNYFEKSKCEYHLEIDVVQINFSQFLIHFSVFHFNFLTYAPTLTLFREVMFMKLWRFIQFISASVFSTSASHLKCLYETQVCQYNTCTIPFLTSWCLASSILKQI